MAENQFLDEVEITVRLGKGGDGMVHFRREPRKALLSAVARRPKADEAIPKSDGVQG